MATLENSNATIEGDVLFNGDLDQVGEICELFTSALLSYVLAKGVPILAHFQALGRFGQPNAV